MVLVRIFDTRDEAERAQQVLKQGGIDSVITEDKFAGVPIQKFGVRARYRLMVEDKDYYKVAKYLADKMKSR
jgi:hypothetical protein